jgi:hypothetical protein
MGEDIMCTYLVTTRDRLGGAFRDSVRACQSLASAEAFVGWLNKCQGIEDDHDLSFSYGVEIKENFRETKGDLPADHLPAAFRR